ncbi:hypothetical protein ACFL2A_01360 [Thermodesulfobacteriota bacterium]
MSFISFGTEFFSIAPPEPYYPMIDHTLETLFLMFFLLATIKKSMPELNKSFVNIFFYVNLATLFISSLLIFFNYAISYEQGISFSHHWGNLVYEASHLTMIEILIFIFTFQLIIKKEKENVLFLLAMLPWVTGHIGHVLNLVIADNYFEPRNWIVWLALATGAILLFYAFKLLYENELDKKNG